MANRFWRRNTAVLAVTAMVASLVAALLAVPLVVLALTLASAQARAVTLDDLLRENIKTMDQLQNFLTRIAYESCQEIAQATGDDIYREYRELQAWRAESKRNLAEAERARDDAAAEAWRAVRAYDPGSPAYGHVPPTPGPFLAAKDLLAAKTTANQKALNDLRAGADALERFRADRRAVEGYVTAISGASGGIRQGFRSVGTGIGYSRTATTPAIQAEIANINNAVAAALGTFAGTYGGPASMAPLSTAVDYDSQTALFAGIAARRNAVAALGRRIDQHPEFVRLRDLEKEKKALEEKNRGLRDKVRQLNTILARIEDAAKAQEAFEVTEAWEGMMAIIEGQIRDCADKRRQELAQAQTGPQEEQGRLTAHWRMNCTHSTDTEFNACVDGTFWVDLDQRGHGRNGEWKPDCVVSPGGRNCGLTNRWVKPSTEFHFEVANGVVDATTTYTFRDDEGRQVNGAYTITGPVKTAGGPLPTTYTGGGVIKGYETVFTADGPARLTCHGRWQTPTPLKCQ
ncbi:MAG: hypothetical protein H6907_15860 [Hyphomicrobiales bacterium]|nr:hypothetical protein [Hyphomicrobiales bacterium]